MAAIASFESYTHGKPFKRFHINQATGFKTHLTEQRAHRSGKPLSAATMHATLSALKAFMIWLADQPGYRNVLRYSDAEYFNISERERAVATARREQPVPTQEQIRHVIAAMPAETEIERRDRAVVAFALLSGARDGAIASLKLKHVDLESRTVLQDAREVHTKFSKTFTTASFPSATTSATSSRAGSAGCGPRSSGVKTTRCSRRRRSRSGSHAGSRRRGLSVSTGAALRRSGTSSETPSPGSACPTSTRTASGRPSPSWASASVAHRSR